MMGNKAPPQLAILIAMAVHHPMQHVQGYIGSHRTPPLGDYLLRITLVATRVAGKTTTMKKMHHLCWSF